MTDPLLFSLADQGDDAGEMVVETLLPKPDSPVIDGGMSAECPGLFGINLVEDQRGRPRPVSGPLRNAERCDIGAVEVQASDPEGVPLTVALTGSGNAAVNASPGSLRCPGRCEDRFRTGETAVLGAQPGFRVEFLGWGGDCTGMANPCELTMDGPKVVTAEFIQLYVIGVQLDGNAPGTVTSMVPGLIDCPGTCAALVREGESVTLEATGAADSRFQNWSGACTGTGSCTVSMMQDQLVTAVFASPDTIFLDDFE